IVKDWLSIYFDGCGGLGIGIILRSRNIKQLSPCFVSFIKKIFCMILNWFVFRRKRLYLLAFSFIGVMISTVNPLKKLRLLKAFIDFSYCSTHSSCFKLSHSDYLM